MSADRRQQNKRNHIARGRADAWIAAERYLTPREHAAFAVDLGLDRHDMFHARRRANDCADPSPSLPESDQT